MDKIQKKYKEPLRFILLFAFALCSVFSVSAQNISFKKLGLEEGLSELAGLCIHQDNLNRMWFGTRNGLNCWDGVKMKNFYPIRGDSTTLQNHKITKILQTENYLWLRSGTGLSRLNLETFSVKRYFFENIQGLTNYNNTILVDTKNGLLIYNTENELFENSNILSESSESFDCILHDDKNRLWLAVQSKPTIIKVENGIVDTINIPIDESFSFFDLHVDSNDRLWIATRYHGIVIYDIELKTFEFINEKSFPFYVESLSIRDILEDNEGRIWVGTFKGLAIFDIDKKTTTFVRANKSDELSLSHNSVYSLYLSNDGNIWVGTYFGGINYGRISNQIFTKYNESISGSRPSYHVIGPMLEDDKNNIWIGTEGGGLDYFNRETGAFTNFPFTNDKSGLSATNVKSLYLSGNNELMIGTYQGGINILDIEKKEFKHFTKPGSTDFPNNINDIIQYNNVILFATEMGVLKFDSKSGSVKDYFESNNISVPNNIIVQELYVDSKGILWAGTVGEGLFSYNSKNNEFKIYRSNEFDTNTLPSNSITFILEDHRFRLWLGTDGGGLCRFNRTEENFTTFNKQTNNLPSDFIFGIEESRFGNLWISTSRGLSRFDVDHNQFFNYTSESGFPLQELNYKSILLTNSGDLFVGGIDGLVSFKEKDLLLIDEELQINFSTLYVNNKEVRANDETGILSRDISVTESFILKPKHTVFSIDFSSFNFNNTLNNKYQYQIE